MLIPAPALAEAARAATDDPVSLHVADEQMNSAAPVQSNEEGAARTTIGNVRPVRSCHLAK